MRSRSVPVVIAAVLAVLLVGAVFASDAALSGSRSDHPAAAADHDTQCSVDVRCAGQTVTAATGPLVPPGTWSAATPIALLAAGFVVASRIAGRDRLDASRLFRPPRFAG